MTEATRVLAGLLVGFLVLLSWRRADREFRRGYMLALDHVETMTRSRAFPLTMDEAVLRLRAEMAAENRSEGSDG